MTRWFQIIILFFRQFLWSCSCIKLGSMQALILTCKTNEFVSVWIAFEHPLPWMHHENLSICSCNTLQVLQIVKRHVCMCQYMFSNKAAVHLRSYLWIVNSSGKRRYSHLEVAAAHLDKLIFKQFFFYKPQFQHSGFVAAAIHVSVGTVDQ